MQCEARLHTIWIIYNRIADVWSTQRRRIGYGKGVRKLSDASAIQREVRVLEKLNEKSSVSLKS